MGRSINYQRASNVIKLVLLVVGPSVSLIRDGGSVAGAAFLSVTAISVVGIVIITLFDIMYNEMVSRFDVMHNEIVSRVALLKDSLQDQFAYSGLIDSFKDEFSAVEMSIKWLHIMDKVKMDFVALNYLDRASWVDGRGDEFVRLLGFKNGGSGIGARRMFIVDSELELGEWRETFRIHAESHVEARYILHSEYLILREKYAKDVKNMSDVLGFNVIDKDSPGIVFDWTYVGRSSSGALLKRGPSSADLYARYFNYIWASPRSCKV